ncbi:MAG: NTF2 fold immunity protein [Roseiarcus sp.]
MEKPKRDGSMVIRSAYQQLISSQTAIEICRMVLVDIYGAEEYELQKPLRVEDGGNMWKVVGSHPERTEPDASQRGPISMSISKIDGAIVSFFN